MTVAKSAESPIPKRTSLPSMLPPVPAGGRRGGDSGRLVDRDCRAAPAVVATNAPARKSTAMAAKTAQPCRTEPVIRPSVFVRPAPIAKIRTICRKLVPGVGFS